MNDLPLEAYKVLFFALAAIMSVAGGIIAYLLKDIRSDLKDQQKDQDQKIECIKNDMADFKATLPRQYVLRDDFIRTTATLEAKLDKMANDTSEIKEAIAKLVGGAK
ncbi:MAG: hypothetical protein PWQ93_383 [Clostridiales bacterium]|jgi:hypothetical protein|nr:hypothetical protein [Clostridiales bacterium]